MHFDMEYVQHILALNINQSIKKYINKIKEILS